MKVLILGASGFLGRIIYSKLKEETDFWVLGTYNKSQKNNELIKLNVNNFIEVRTFLEHFKANVVVWCLTGKTSEKELIKEGLPNVLNNINHACKFVFVSTNAKEDGERLVKELNDYIIIKLEDIYAKDVIEKWDKRISKLIEAVK